MNAIIISLVCATVDRKTIVSVREMNDDDERGAEKYSNGKKPNGATALFVLIYFIFVLNRTKNRLKFVEWKNKCGFFACQWISLFD